MSAFSPILDGLHPVFIVGHPRSGTTLVQQLLTAHAAFWSAPETHLYSVVLTPVQGWENRSLHPDEVPGILARLSQKPAIELDKAATAAIVADSRRGQLGGAKLLDHIMRAHKPLDSAAARWLEKTPRHVYHLDTILRFFPDARIIHVLRDPRGVASSPSRFGELQPGLDRSAIVVERGDSWNGIVALTDAMAAEPRMITVRYEDVVGDQEAALRRLMDHVGVEYDPSVPERFSSTYAQVTVTRENVRKQLNSVGEIVDRRTVYKQRMTAEEIALTDTICGDKMRQKGYNPDGEPQPDLVARVRAQVPQRTYKNQSPSSGGIAGFIKAVRTRVQRRLGLIKLK